MASEVFVVTVHLSCIFHKRLLAWPSVSYFGSHGTPFTGSPTLVTVAFPSTSCNLKHHLSSSTGGNRPEVSERTCFKTAVRQVSSNHYLSCGPIQWKHWRPVKRSRWCQQSTRYSLRHYSVKYTYCVGGPFLNLRCASTMVEVQD